MQREWWNVPFFIFCAFIKLITHVSGGVKYVLYKYNYVLCVDRHSTYIMRDTVIRNLQKSLKIFSPSYSQEVAGSRPCCRSPGLCQKLWLARWSPLRRGHISETCSCPSQTVVGTGSLQTLLSGHTYSRPGEGVTVFIANYTWIENWGWTIVHGFLTM